MRTKLRGKFTLLFVMLAVLIAIPAIALADVVQNNVDATAGQKIVSVQAGQTSGQIGYKINDTGGDTTDTSAGSQNCNPAVKAAKLTLSGLPSGVTVQNTSGTTLTAPHLTFTSCDTYQYVKLAVGSSVVAGDYTVSVADITNDGFVTNDFNENPATFTLRVTGGGSGTTNTAPQVSVTGVANGVSYEINDVPTPGCSVVDAEDTGESATPVKDSSGLNSYGLGQEKITCTYTDNGGITRSASVTYTIADTGDPVITEQSHTPDPADGLNGWHVSAVTTTFQAEDFNGTLPTPDVGAGFLSPLTNPFNFNVGSGAAEGDNVSINSGTKFDVAGNESNSVSSGPYKIDLTDPTVSINLTPAKAATGWYNIATWAPTADYTCNDADGDNNATNGGASGIAPNGCTPDYTFDEGAGQSHEGNATDNAGRSDQTPASVSGVNVDLTRPSLGTIVDNNAASSNVCTTSSAPTQPTGFDPSDGLSGINASQTGQTWTSPPGSSSTNPFGTYTYEAHATDVAGNTNSYGPNNYSYTYGIGSGGLAYNGVLQPINMPPATGTFTPSVFKLGSTIPVKFTLACGQTPYGNAVANLFVKKSDNTVASDVNEAISTSAATTGSLFRYDASAGQYIFNLSTKSGYTDANGTTQQFSAGTWTITIKFADGTTKIATFDIKK